ncbi:MAG TPA: c-type cytochrome [Xanthobacteraceae bacterium]|nr:c-type cytochrome [Xanthobacteraceae bacterium]
MNVTRLKSSRTLLLCGLVAAVSAAGLQPIHAQLRGHGGPVRALAISSDGTHVVSGSFDTSAIRWSLSRNVAEQVMRFHDGPVNAVAFLKDSRIVTAGGDAHIAVWTPGQQAPDRVLDGHTGPIVALAVSPDGKTLASASWDRTVRLWPLAGGPPRVLEGNAQNVNGVAFSADGTRIMSAGYDGTVRMWQIAGDSVSVHNLPSPLNTVVTTPDGEMIAAGASGKVFFLSSTGEMLGELQAGTTPIIQLAISNNGLLVAAASTRGSVAVIDRKQRTLMHTLVGPGLPVWAVAFLPDNSTLLTGGTDSVIRRWNAVTGEPIDSTLVGVPEDPLKRYAGDHGAEVFRACIACHTLRADEAQKAGPTLWHIFGRRIATLLGYNFSPALKNLNIVWSKETVAKLFEIGPAHYTPGTKMPEQTIGSEADRKALVDFLARATTN